MGYKPKKQRYELVFPEYPGLEVICRGMSVGQTFDMAEIDIKVQQIDHSKRMAMYEFFADRLVTWNIEHPDIDLPKDQDKDGRCVHCGLLPGEPLPTTAEVMLCLDSEFIHTVIFGYMTAVARGSLPKELSTENGMNQTDMLMRTLGELQNPGQYSVPRQS